MKELRRENLRLGMIIGQDVYNNASQLIIPEGTVLTEYVIMRLEQYSIRKVMIMDEDPNKDLSTENINKFTETKKFKEFKKEYDEEIHTFQDSLNQIVGKNSNVDIDHMYQNMVSLINGGEGVNIIDMVANLRQYDDSTYAHAVNVSLICNMLAQWLKFSAEDVKMATMCGLLHDVGKIKIPSEIIKKPGKLTEEEFAIVKGHSFEGYKILNRQNVDLQIQYAALMHHERCDGSGYPIGLKREQINPFAKIVAIADVYDAMTSKRVYRGPVCPFEVIRIFEDEGLRKYETEYIMTFLQRVADTYMNAEVKLTDGREGKVVFINKMQIHAPTIQCGGDIVDLSRERELKVAQIL